MDDPMTIKPNFKHHTDGALPKPGNESGAILFVCIILLIVLTLLGSTALLVSRMQERMAGNARDRAIAFQAAEAALRAAEKLLSDNAPTASGTYDGSACKKGVFELVNNVPYFASSSGHSWDGSDIAFWNDWPWSSDSCYYIDNISLTDFAQIGKPVEKPRYVIEEMPAVSSGGKSYRVTAMGYGSSKKAQVILQATFASY